MITRAAAADVRLMVTIGTRVRDFGQVRAIAEAHAGQVTATSGQGANLLRSGVSASRCQAPKLTTMSSGCLGSVG